MKHQIYKITSIEITAPYTLLLKFDDSTCKEINFKNVLYGEMYSPLNDQDLFNKVKIDPEVSTIVWPNGADFDPETLHDWEKYESELIRRAGKWKVTEK